MAIFGSTLGRAATATDDDTKRIHGDSFVSEWNGVHPGPDWVASNSISTAPRIIDYALAVGSAAGYMRYIRPTSTDNHFSQIVVPSDGLPLDTGPAVAMGPNSAASGSGFTPQWYLFRRTTSTTVAISHRTTGSTYVNLVSVGSTTINPGDILRLEHNNGVLTAYINGTQVLTNTPGTRIWGQKYVGVAYASVPTPDARFASAWTGGDLGTFKQTATAYPTSPRRRYIKHVDFESLDVGEAASTANTAAGSEFGWDATAASSSQIGTADSPEGRRAINLTHAAGSASFGSMLFGGLRKRFWIRMSIRLKSTTVVTASACTIMQPRDNDLARSSGGTIRINTDRSITFIGFSTTLLATPVLPDGDYVLWYYQEIARNGIGLCTVRDNAGTLLHFASNRNITMGDDEVNNIWFGKANSASAVTDLIIGSVSMGERDSREPLDIFQFGEPEALEPPAVTTLSPAAITTEEAHGDHTITGGDTPVSVVGITTADSGAANSAGPLTPALPSGWQPDDIFIFVAAGNPAAQVFTKPTGYTEVRDVAATNARYWMGWKKAEVGDTAQSISQSTANQFAAALICLRGADVNDLFGTAEAITSTGPATATPPFPGVTPRNANDFLLYIGGTRASVAGQQPTFSTPPAGGAGGTVTERLDLVTTSGGQNVGIAVWTQQLTAATAVGSTTVTASATVSFNGEVLAIKRAPVASPQTTNPAPIISEEAHGVHSITSLVNLEPAGMASGEVFGNPVVTAPVPAVTLNPAAIATGEAFGSPTRTSSITLSPTGFDDGTVFGVPVRTSSITLNPGGIVGAEGFGTPALSSVITLSPAAIGSGEAFGSPLRSSTITLSPATIASLEAFGVPVRSSTITLSPAAIGGGEAFGAPALSAVIVLSPAVIGSGEAFGSPIISANIPGQTLNPTGIASAEAAGSPALTRNVTLVPIGIVSGEAFGAPTRSSIVVLAPVSIGSAEAVPNPVLGSVVTLFPTGLASAESVGTPTLTSAVILSPAGVASQEVFGVPTVGSGLVLSPVGIATGQAFGTPVRTSTITLSPAAIASLEAFGTPVFNVKRTLSPTGIASAQAFGTPVRTSTIILLPGGILGQEIVPNVVLTGDGAIPTFSGWGIPLG